MDDFIERMVDRDLPAELAQIAIPIRNHIFWLHEGIPGWSVVMAYDDGANEVTRVIWAESSNPIELDALAVEAAQHNLSGESVHLCMGLRKEFLPQGRGGKKDVLCIPALWADLDDGDPAAFRKVGAPPNVIVQSSQRGERGGYHAYWLLERPIPPGPEVERVMAVMARLIGSDEAVARVDRNLRLCGSINWKPGRDEWRTIMVGDVNLRRRYTWQTFAHLDPGPEPERPVQPRTWTDGERNDQFVSAREIAESSPHYRKTSKGWMIPCPVPSHGKGTGDRSPSLHITTGENGTVLLKCFAGCAFEDIVHALGLDAKNLFPERSIDPHRQPDDAWRIARQRRNRS